MPRADRGALPLAELQRFMRRILEARDGTAGAPSSLARRVDALVVPSSTLMPRERIDIYARMYAYRLQDALATDFPAVAAAMGEHDFWHLTRDYVAQRPSRYFNLNAYSAAFPAYVGGRRDVKHRAFLGELATLEWAMTDVVHSRTTAAPDFSALANATPEQWEGARFRVVPAARLFEFHYPVNTYYQAFREGKRAPVPRPEKSWLVVQRRQFVVWRISLTRAGFAVLDALAGGAALRQAVERALRLRVLDAASLERALFRWFREWASDGLFERVELPAVARGKPRAPLFERVKGGVKLRDRGRVRRDATEAVLTSRSEAAASK